MRLPCLILTACLLLGNALAQPARPASLQDISAALDSHPVSAGKQEELQQTLTQAISPDAPVEERIRRELARARAAQTLGLAQARIDALRAALALGGGDNPARLWKELAEAEANGGHFRQAIEACRQAIALNPPQRRGQLMALYSTLADLHRSQGDFAQARATANEMEALLFRLARGPAWANYGHVWQATVEFAIGRVEFGAGRYAEAEARLRKAIAEKEQDNERNRGRDGQGDSSPTQDQAETQLDFMTIWLARSIAAQGRLHEAEALARKALLGAIGRGGGSGLTVGNMLQHLSHILQLQGRFPEALALLDRAAQNFARAGVAPHSLLSAQNRRQRAGLLSNLQRWPEAVAEYEASLQGLGPDSPLAGSFQLPNLGWIRSLHAVGRSEEAIVKARALYQSLSQRLGAKAYDTAEARGYLGALLVETGRDDEALPTLRAALDVLLPAIAQAGDKAGLRFQRLSFVVNRYLRALARIRGTPLEKKLGIDAADEAFVAADVLRGQSVAQAMQASALRAAAGDPALADLVRREQDSRQERNALYTILADLLSRPADQALPQTIAAMRQRTAELDTIQRAALIEIRERFPNFADLTSPRPPRIAEMQAVMHADEAVISILPGEQQTLVWAIPARGPARFAAVPIGAAEIRGLVNKLRGALDPGEVELDRLPLFDPQAAHRLYAELLAPVTEGWQGAGHLFIAAGGPLARLPFAVLLSEPVELERQPAGPAYGYYRHWPWLIKHLSISQLPSAASLLTLRRMAPGAPGRRAFAGFGDPDFGGPAPAARQRRLRATSQFAPRQASEVNYASIAPLPDTRTEILSLAKTLQADPQRDVFLGPKASRDTVLQADLAQRRIVAFATHGLLAGEYPGIDQPALALANPGGGQHGLLLLDDILTLKLDADWVILSACNTAAGDGKGGEAVSGLGRGFFYAGSRSLLVTHWPVESVSAQKLVVGIFDEMEKTPNLHRSEALRLSMLKLKDETGQEGKLRFYYAHPMFWAPYALIGDGG